MNNFHIFCTFINLIFFVTNEIKRTIVNRTPSWSKLILNWMWQSWFSNLLRFIRKDDPAKKCNEDSVYICYDLFILRLISVTIIQLRAGPPHPLPHARPGKIDLSNLSLTQHASSLRMPREKRCPAGTRDSGKLSNKTKSRPVIGWIEFPCNRS